MSTSETSSEGAGSALEVSGVNKELVASGASKLGFVKSRDLWFNDGSVVLVADKTAFRVHASILSSNASVFQDMFSLPPSNLPDSELYEGCPFVVVHDSPTDLRHFLKTIYDLSYFRSNSKVKFEVLAAIARLSTKYDSPYLRQRAIDTLATTFPSSLSGWDNRHTSRLIPPFQGALGQCLSLAVECDFRVILPSLYFLASRFSLPDVASAFRSTQLGEQQKWDLYTDCLHGLERLRQAETTQILAFLDYSFVRPGCQNNANCSDKLNRTRSEAIKKAVDSKPYAQWCSVHASEVGAQIGLCEPCKKTVTESITVARSAIWDQLPQYFGLPDWDTLEAEARVFEDTSEAK
ncbi:hypothetical protein JAAARDRAFT_165405 [Jaapia argillacea MUCL 33604]|uniref:BTB domain-containing protein n=1 Tax=Jaapia argillacea MUCL 33604 TaxID=933084 RepID=A0A067P7A4_9AGAM|nr:hypothetical protein JAAARDRAFT_165405 [Jaapia argillacea MUCL 33604]